MTRPLFTHRNPCETRTWFILLVCAVDIHCCVKTIKNTSASHATSPVLAMTAALTDPPGEPLGEPDSDLGTKPHYRFTRQPVKYYRHHNPGNHLSGPGHSAIEPAAPVRGHPGSADSSRSSSPEPGTQTLPQNLDCHCKNTCQPHQSTTATESKAGVPLNPREIVQYMLGLDSTVTAPEAGTASGTTPNSSREEAAGCQADINLTNNRQSAGQSWALSQSKTLPVEHKLPSPTQKVLSGLKLRRSHSGKDEQLFV